MSVSNGPKLITDGLVFYYDINNTKKSWKGKPTTNLISIDGWNTNFNGSSPYWYSMTRTAETTDTLFEGVVVGKGVTSATQSYGFGYLDLALPTGTTAGVVYACSFYYKSLSRTAEVWCHDTTGANSVYSGTIPATGNWARGVALFTSSTTGAIRLHFHLGAGAVGDTIYITAPMIEQGTYATPFVSGTRSNTQAIVDLVSSSTVTANSLTYNSGGTFSFDGTNSFSFPSIDFSSEQTIEIWLKSTENDSNRRNPYNQAYGGYGTWTHEPDGVINYYYGDAGINSGPYIGHTSPFTVAQNEVACVCTVRNTNGSRWYKNGIFYNSVSHIYGTLTTDNNSIIIGTGYAGGYLGEIYSVKLYNRALTDAEVFTNFISERGRYGI